MDYMLLGPGLSAANYSSALVGWQGQTHQSNVLLRADGLKFNSSASAARAALVNNDDWNITDGGLAP
jgi:hypothetical protein